MDRAIKEIVTGIVQRSVSIATQTTKELVLKDYAMESDQTRILLAAHLMVASLAPSLAHTRQQGSSFLTELMQNLVRLPNEAASAGTRYNVPLINSLVLYVGMQCRCLSLCWIVLRDPTVLMLFCLTSVLVM
ncbi:hypothetical protein ACFXTH_040532 [Malus domestica]